MAYSVKAFKIPYASRTAKGTPLPHVLPLPAGAHVTSALPIEDGVVAAPHEYLVLLTERGKIKKIPLSALRSLGTRGLVVMKLADDDTLKWVRRCSSPHDELVLATK